MNNKLKYPMTIGPILACLAAVGCAHAQPLASVCEVPGNDALLSRVSEHSAAEQRLMEVEREACELFAGRDMERAMEIVVAPHGIVLMDKAGIAVGRETQLEMFRSWFDAGNDIVWEPFDAHVSEAEDMGWVVGTIKHTEPSGKINYGKYVSVWEKVDGDWKNVLEMRNDNGALGHNLKYIE